ncbi:hypothetical protein FFF34_000635 [Inquilinus sp. KBS0705]|nr:hypothetical protein FFF34_000635 [Inquilinus sp. KBS0705]
MKANLFAIAIVLLIIVSGLLGSCKKEARIYRIVDADFWKTHLTGTYKLVSRKSYIHHPETDSVETQILDSGCRFSARYIFKSPNIFIYKKSACDNDSDVVGTYKFDNVISNLQIDAKGFSPGGSVDTLTDTSFIFWRVGMTSSIKSKFVKVAN